MNMDVGTLEEWKLTRGGWYPLYLRKYKYYEKEYWEMSTGKNQYGRFWGKLADHFTEEIIREQIESNNGVELYSVKTGKSSPARI